MAPVARLKPHVYPHRIVATWLRHVWLGQIRSLGGRLQLILACLMLVLLGLEWIQHNDRTASRVRLLEATNREVAQTSANAAAGNVEDTLRQERTIGDVVFNGYLREEQVRTYLQNLRQQDENLLSIQVIEPNGYVRYLEPGRALTSQASEPFFQEVLREGRYVSPVVTPPASDEPFVRIALAQRGSAGELAGVIAVEYRVNGSGRPWLDPTSEPNHVDALLDQNQVPVGFQGDARLVQVVRDSPLLRETRPNHPLAIPVPGSDEPLMGYAAPIPGIGWTMIHLRSDEKALAEVNEQTTHAVLALVLAMVAFAFAAILVVRLGLRPHRRLSIVAERLGGGDLSLRLPRAELVEFEQLVSSFNRMAERLESAQTALTEANQELEQRVAERTRQLEEQHDKLLRAERLSTLGLFSSAIAHELRTPLNTISLSLFWLKTQLATNDERVRSRLQVMEREVHRSERIIQTLLAFARTGEPHPAPVELGPLVKEVVDVARPDGAIAVHTELAPDVPPLMVDRPQVFQVLDNLIRNAIQAMPDGGTLRIRAERDGRWCHLSVSDTGPGIPEERHESIFEPLITTKSSGTGLGLALCKRIVDAHGGRIWVTSTEGEGATFHLCLPLAGG